MANVFTADIFILFSNNWCILPNISLKIVHEGPNYVDIGPGATGG